jgi:hypothetical protein
MWRIKEENPCGHKRKNDHTHRIRVSGQISAVASGSVPLNPPGVLIGRKVIGIEIAGMNPPKLAGNFSEAYGMPNGTAFIKGFVTNLPKGYITALEYIDEEKARRMGLSPVDKPWRHDFSGMHVKAYRVKGGILLKGDKPVWESR